VDREQRDVLAPLSRFRFVAATMRTSTRRSCVAPTGRISPSCSTRSSLLWRDSGISVTSSRNSVPPSAISKSPFFSSCAPVNAPFLCPNSSLSSRFSGTAAQLAATKSLSRRRER
jgi:hypothetical protein